MASLSARLILAMRALSMEPRPTLNSDLARPPGGDHAATQQASPGVLGAQRAAGDRRRGTCTRVLVTRSEASRNQTMLLPGRLGDQRGAGRQRTGPSRWRTGAGGPGVDPGRQLLSGVLTERSLIGWRQRHSAWERTLHVWPTHAHVPLQPRESDINSF